MATRQIAQRFAPRSYEPQHLLIQDVDVDSRTTVYPIDICWWDLSDGARVQTPLSLAMARQLSRELFNALALVSDCLHLPRIAQEVGPIPAAEHRHEIASRVGLEPVWAEPSLDSPRSALGAAWFPVDPWWLQRESGETGRTGLHYLEALALAEELADAVLVLTRLRRPPVS